MNWERKRKGVRICGLFFSCLRLLNLAPPEERSASIGLTNSISGLFAFSTVLGGYLSDRLGFPALFLLAALFYALALYAGRKLPEEG